MNKAATVLEHLSVNQYRTAGQLTELIDDDRIDLETVAIRLCHLFKRGQCLRRGSPGSYEYLLVPTEPKPWSTDGHEYLTDVILEYLSTTEYRPAAEVSELLLEDGHDGYHVSAAYLATRLSRLWKEGRVVRTKRRAYYEYTNKIGRPVQSSHYVFAYKLWTTN